MADTLSPPEDKSPTIESSPAALALTVEDLYTAWKTNREGAGLDSKWNHNWEAYKGITDDQWKSDEGTGRRSSTHIQVTKARCMMAYAMIVDLVLQGGEMPFDLKLGRWQGVPDAQIPPEVRKELERRAKSTRDRIKTQFAMGHADRSLSKGILSAAIYGEAYAKITHRRFEEAGWELDTDNPGDVTTIPSQAQTWVKRTSSMVGPAINYVHVWDIFRDLEDPDPRQGRGFIHRQPQTPSWLRTRKSRPFFINDAIERVLAKHKGTTDPDTGVGTLATPDTSTMSPRMRSITARSKSLIVKEFWGQLPRAAVEDYEREQQDGNREVPTRLELDQLEGDDVECHVMICEGEVIRFCRTERTDRPLYRLVWEEGLEEDEATGVADNVQDLQKVTNGAFRAIEDNIRQTCNTIWALYEPYIENAEDIKSKGMQPGTVVWLKDARAINEAIQQLPVADVTAPLITLVQLCMQMLDNDSLIPRTQMGVGDSSRSTTAYEVSTQIASSTKYIGAVIRRIDECWIEPIGAYFYEYAMRDPSNPDKGNFIVQATGFQSYHDRLLVFDQISRMMQLFMSNPLMAVHANVRACMEAIAKALDQDPEIFLKSEQEAMQMMQAMQTDPLKLAQQNKAEADARQSQAAAMKLLNDIKMDVQASRRDNATAAQQIRMESVMAERPAPATAK